VFANRISWRKITITSLTEATVGTTTNVRHKRNKIVTLNVTQKFCVQARKRPETFWQTLARTRPRTLNPARPEKPGPNYNSAIHAKTSVGCFIRFRLNKSTLYQKHRKQITFSFCYSFHFLLLRKQQILLLVENTRFAFHLFVSCFATIS